MKKGLCLALTLCLSGVVFAAETKEAPAPAECSLPQPAAIQTAAKPAEKPALTPAEPKTVLKARRKLIKKLVKQYRKANEADKPAIKEKLSAVVGEGVDAGLAYVKERLAAERANLDNWEKKVAQSEANLAQVKAQRVEDLLSGEAERKHKAAQKAWKQEMKSARSRLR